MISDLPVKCHPQFGGLAEVRQQNQVQGKEGRREKSASRKLIPVHFTAPQAAVDWIAFTWMEWHLSRTIDIVPFHPTHLAPPPPHINLHAVCASIHGIKGTREWSGASQSVLAVWKHSTFPQMSDLHLLRCFSSELRHTVTGRGTEQHSRRKNVSSSRCQGCKSAAKNQRCCHTIYYEFELYSLN